MSRSSDISVVFTNIRSVLKKRDELCSIVDTTDADVIVLTETWLSGKIQNCELFDGNKTFNVYRHDRQERCGGGVLIAIADHIKSFSVDVICELEITWVGLLVNHKKWIMGVCYRPPSYSLPFVEALHNTLNTIMVRFPGAPIFLLGDFNFPSISWSNDVPCVNVHSEECISFINLCLDFSLSQLVLHPTRVTQSTANVLDLILTNHPEYATPITYLPEISDHKVLHFSLKASATRPTFQPKQIRDYGKANFEQINNDLAIFLNQYLTTSSGRSVEDNWNIIKLKFISLINKHVPLRNIFENTQSPWFTKALKRLSNKKNAYIVLRSFQRVGIAGLRISCLQKYIKRRLQMRNQFFFQILSQIC